MKNKLYIFFSILFCIATLFMGVGYASINSISLNVNGQMIAQAQDGDFITDVEFIASESFDADLANTKINSAYQSILNSFVVLSDLNGDSNMMFEVTIHNSTSDIYIFDGVSYEDEFYSNSNITYEVVGFDVEDELLPGESVKFKLNFYYLPDSFVASSGKIF